MTNPNNSVGTNGAFGGRTSVNAFNDVMAAFIGRGIISGWEISSSSGMTVAIGGDGVNRDVAVAEDNAGNKTSVNNISQAPINLAIMAAPATNNRIDAIVAYVDNPPSGASTVVDNYGACGLIDVPGTVSASPSAPDESAIRTAITTDGGAGATAYYVVIGYVNIAAGTTDITSDMITAGPYAQIGTNQIADKSVTSDKIDFTTLNTGFASRITANISLGSSQFIEIGNLRIATVQTANHTIAAGETIITLRNTNDMPSSAIIGTGVIQGTGNAVSIILYGEGSSNAGRVQVGSISVDPSGTNRVCFTLIWQV